MNCDCECCVLLAALLRARRDRHEDLASEINHAMVEAGFVAGFVAEPEDECCSRRVAVDCSSRWVLSVPAHFKAIYKALSEGPKSKVELEKIIGKQSPCFVRVLDDGN